MTTARSSFTAPQLTVYYDGACRVCSAEMAHYRRLDRGGRLAFVDIAAAAFDPVPLGLTADAFQAQLHVRTADGRWLRAIDAFLALWDVLPGYRFRLLRRLVGAPLFRPLADSGYRLFARYRYLLPKHECAGTCALHGIKKGRS